MTNIELITQAYRALNLINEEESPSAEQGVQGLALQNQMLEQWEGDEIFLQYFEQSDLQAEFPCQTYTHKGVIGKLCEALCAHYGFSMTPEAQKLADDGYQTIIRKAVVDITEPLDMSHLPMGSGHGSCGNILTGDD